MEPTQPTDYDALLESEDEPTLEELEAAAADLTESHHLKGKTDWQGVEAPDE